MSTICKICVKARLQEVELVLRSYLTELGQDFVESASEWPADDFRLGRDFPTILSFAPVTSTVVEIHYNCFSHLVELANRLTTRTSSIAVVNIYQSAATASCWAYHVNGKLRRAIEAGDGHISSSLGDKLEFERRVFDEQNPNNEFDLPASYFDYEFMDKYNEAVGVNVKVYQEHAP